MEKELNIAAILNDKPLDTKLWTDMFGEVTLDYVSKKGNGFNVKHHKGVLKKFLPNGKLYEEGTLSIFPSREMRDWSKFAWKKGDVLSFGVNNLCIFNKWENDEYTEFYAEFITPSYTRTILNTKYWVKVTNKNTIKQYISMIEEIRGGKLNLETLQIEKQPEFKDGDIVYLNTKNGLQYVFAYDANKGMTTSYIVAYCINFEEFANFETQYICRDNMINRIHLASNSDKQQLFDALVKKNKAWNPDTKQIEDLPTKCEYKPMDWCLMKDNGCEWTLCQFSHITHLDNNVYKYVAVGAMIFKQCIPYNDSTQHLLGTTDEWEGGEG